MAVEALFMAGFRRRKPYANADNLSETKLYRLFLNTAMTISAVTFT
jgi:hypothetical protein